MAKPKNGKKSLDSCVIKGTCKIVKVGDTVLMRSEDPVKPPYIARVEKIEANSRGNVKVRVRWYYHLEESMSCHKQFHDQRKCFDVQSADIIEGKCTVHAFKTYMKLEAM